MLLSGIRRYTARELADRFGMTERNILRDFNTIEAAGFVIDRNNGYKLYMDQSQNKDLMRLLHFSEDEIAILYNILTTIEGDSAIIEQLMKKMNAFYNLKAIAELSKKNDMAKVQIIREAIDKKRQVILKAYRSSNSETINDRLVEAFRFMQDYQTVWCYDCQSHSCKQFKISRMEAIELQNTGWRFEDVHTEPFTDIFRYSETKSKCTVELQLTLKAYNALIEEFPRSVEHLHEKGHQKYYLKCAVSNFTGIGRFILSMLEDVEIIKPVSLKNHIRKRLEKFLER